MPLEATLGVKPPKLGISKFKAERQANVSHPNTNSHSLGASVLPQGKSSELRTAVRLGKLNEGQLVGGEEGESASEGENSEEYKRSIELLKAGIIVDNASQNGESSGISRSTENNFTDKNNSTSKSSSSLVASALSSEASGSAPSPAASRFLAQRATHKQAARPSLPSLSGSVVERKPPAAPRVNDTHSTPSQSNSNTNPSKPTPSPSPSTFRKPPTGISKPSASPPASHSVCISSSCTLNNHCLTSTLNKTFQQPNRPFAVPQVTPDPVVLSNMIVDSPSFPRPGGVSNKDTTQRPSPIVSEVRESTRRSSSNVSEITPPPATTGRTASRVSRFKAERSM